MYVCIYLSNIRWDVSSTLLPCLVCWGVVLYVGALSCMLGPCLLFSLFFFPMYTCTKCLPSTPDMLNTPHVVYIYKHTYIYTYTYMNKCIYIYIYIYVYIYISLYIYDDNTCSTHIDINTVDAYILVCAQIVYF